MKRRARLFIARETGYRLITKKMTQTISWEDFEKVELCAGKIIKVEDFSEAKKPAYKIWADFGELGIKQSSAQITAHYRKEDLIGKLIIGVLNFPVKRVAGFESEFLTTGFYREDGTVILAVPDDGVPLGAKMG